jgi:hypothetical protein
MVLALLVPLVDQAVVAVIILVLAVRHPHQHKVSLVGQEQVVRLLLVVAVAVVVREPLVEMVRHQPQVV